MKFEIEIDDDLIMRAIELLDECYGIRMTMLQFEEFMMKNPSIIGKLYQSGHVTDEIREEMINAISLELAGEKWDDNWSELFIIIIGDACKDKDYEFERRKVIWIGKVLDGEMKDRTFEDETLKGVSEKIIGLMDDTETATVMYYTATTRNRTEMKKERGYSVISKGDYPISKNGLRY